MDYQIFVVSAPGMEAITAQEVATLRLADDRAAQQIAGGVEFTGSLADLYRANVLLRTASRVTVRLGEFYAAAFSELRKKASRLPWERYLRPGQPVALRATCRKSKLYHSDAVVERVLGAIADRLGISSPLIAADEEDAEQPAQLVVVRLFNDLCTVSIDSSGALLHRRGYRLATAKAPLRETLAAGMVLASDRDAGAIRAAEANAARAGVANDIAFTCQAVSAIAPPPGPGWVITNPPYGVRVSDNKDLRNLYAQFGNVLRAQCPGWKVAFLCSSLPLVHQTGLRVDTSLSWVNGGLRVRLAQGVV